MGNLYMVHAFEVNNYFIALDVNSGSIHALDEVTYDILKAFPNGITRETVLKTFEDKYDSEIIDEVLDDILQLKQQGLLYSEELDEDRLLSQLHRDTGIKALCLHAAHDCNLGCEYCFASKGDYSTDKSLMSYEVACKSLDFLVENAGARRKVEIDFFGGEPLLNFDLIKKTVAYGKELEKRTDKEFHFTITTNGTLLDQDKIDFINEHMDNVVISLDGRKDINDSMRPDRGKHGTHDKIVSKAKQLVNSRNGKQYYMRGTFTAKNLDFSEDVFHIANLGFKEVSVEPVVGSGEVFHLTMDHIPAILKEYDKLAIKYLDYTNKGKELNYYHFNINLYDGPCIHRRVVACGAGFEYLAVSPEGHLYPCHQFVGQTEFIMGDVYKGIDKPEMGADFKDCNIFTKKECSSCWAKYFCSGGCHANAYFSNDDIAIPNELACIMQKRRIECAMMVEMAKAGF
ncbi:MAG TPA: thioether cross-link-forming SCIFF peptide maturase [Clostridia bacterium]|nr:thioether cross-link-forming SCIFF peptide maturase [Clostridia bacterium]